MNNEILIWSEENWPNRTPQNVEDKLYEEVNELKQALENETRCSDMVNIAEELFDVYAMIVDYAHIRGINLKKMFEVKKIIVELRKTKGKDKEIERELIKAFL